MERELNAGPRHPNITSHWNITLRFKSVFCLFVCATVYHDISETLHQLSWNLRIMLHSLGPKNKYSCRVRGRVLLGQKPENSACDSLKLAQIVYFDNSPSDILDTKIHPKTGVKVKNLTFYWKQNFEFSDVIHQAHHHIVVFLLECFCREKFILICCIHYW